MISHPPRQAEAIFHSVIPGSDPGSRLDEAAEKRKRISRPARGAPRDAEAQRERRRGKKISHPLGDSLEGTEFTERRVRRTATFLLR
jgi:hypothetical protein